MGNYDSRIPLGVQHPNVLGAMGQGQRMGAISNEIQHTNALRDLYQQQGADILKGDENALGALAGLDPKAAMNIQTQQQNMDVQRQRLEMAKAEGARAAQRLQAQMSANQIAQEQDQIKRGLSAAMTAQTPEEWDAIASQYGAEDLVGQFDNREAVIAFYSGLDSTLDRMKPSDSAADQKISRIMNAYGVDYQTATGIADGVLRVSRDPYTDAIQITNLATDEVWTPSARDETPAAQPAKEQPTTGQPDLTFGESNSDAGDAFGFEGMAKGTINTVTDFATGQEAFPDVGDTSRDLNLLREEIQQDLASGYNRQPPSWALKAIRELIPSPGSFQGASSARGQLETLERRFDQELMSASRNLEERGNNMSPEERTEAEAKIGSLARSRDKIRAAIRRFDSGGDEGETSSGVRWRVVD